MNCEILHCPLKQYEGECHSCLYSHLIAVFGSRAWKFTPSGALTKSVEALPFNMHIPRFTKFYQNLQGDFCSFRRDCAYCLQLDSKRGHSNSDLFLHNKSSFCSSLMKTQRPHRLRDIVKDGTKTPLASLQATEIWKSGWYSRQSFCLLAWSSKDTSIGWRNSMQELPEVWQREKTSHAPGEE